MFVRRHLSGVSPPSLGAPAEAVNAVAVLRENESSWNRALQRVLIRAEDIKSESLVEAKDLLLAFARECPWVLFKEVATNQASWY